MKRKTIAGLWILGLLAVSACVDPIAVEMQRSANAQLVVEGWVNDVDDVFTVSLSTSSTLDGVEPVNIGVGADVRIVTGSGQVANLREISPGKYITTFGELRGVVGETYTLEMDLLNGSSYRSTAETLPTPVRVGDGRVELNEFRGETDERVPIVSYSHRVFVNLENTEDQHFVRLSASGWAQLRIDYPLCGGFDGTGGPAGDLLCWAFREPVERDINTVSNVGLSGNTYEAQAVNIPADFRARYITDVAANAMSIEAFRYWENAKGQLNRGGGIFDPPFAPVIGNISNIADPQEVVLGYFHAYAQTNTRVCFSRNDVPGFFPIPVISCERTCTDFYAPAVFELPFDDDAICP